MSLTNCKFKAVSEYARENAGSHQSADRRRPRRKG